MSPKNNICPKCGGDRIDKVCITCGQSLDEACPNCGNTQSEKICIDCGTNLENNLAPEMRCSFCGKKHDEVKTLLAGPMIYICNECVQLCYEILNEEKEEPLTGAASDERL